MKKWLIITSLAVLILIGISAGAYIHALKPKDAAYKRAFSKAQNEAGLVTKDKFYIYNGMESYYVIVGKDKNKKQKAVWIPFDKKQKVVIKDFHSGKTEEDIRKIVSSEADPDKIVTIKLGMEKSVPLWEVTYLDNKRRYNYEYYEFKTGELLKFYRNI
ncbi:peptidase [Bacillus sp. M6-12]|uniref:cell wall elongation regulator TseB-like domain-containing protein n=1 Tax=Bacillus sp. M6-12 TaxID=2054166 RepID=UPI000C75B93C|nr:DUF5590 domain-containing protein [Bacillus sp. M6-12]PLS16322.1 peptidase [Bacillus sp. M6-12]